MIAYQITDVKECMNHMLLKGDFDTFSLVEATITTKTSFVIDGAVADGYYTEDELQQMKGNLPAFASFGELRPICLDIIKGKKTPQYFKFVFGASKELIAHIIREEGLAIAASDVSSMALNIRYQNGILYATTGVSLKIFTPDRSLEHAWDSYIEKFFNNHGISWQKVA